MKKTKADLVRAWIKKAQKDLDVAELLVHDGNFLDIACFHTQQAAEKFLKGYIIWLDLEYRKTHDLVDLITIASQEDDDILRLKEYGASLTHYAVESRYPEFEEPLLEDAQEALEYAKKIRGYVLEKLPEEMKG